MVDEGSGMQSERNQILQEDGIWDVWFFGSTVHLFFFLAVLAIKCCKTQDGLPEET